MDEMIFTLVTHNNNDTILRSGSILFDEVVGHAAQWVHVWCHLTIFKCQPRPAWFQPSWNDRSAPYFYLFWVCSTSESAFLYVCFCFAKAAAIFCELPSSIYFFFWSENICRTFGPADWRILSDIMKKCPIVRQVRRISTALRLQNCVNVSPLHCTGWNIYFNHTTCSIFHSKEWGLDEQVQLCMCYSVIKSQRAEASQDFFHLNQCDFHTFQIGSFCILDLTVVF